MSLLSLHLRSMDLDSVGDTIEEGIVVSGGEVSCVMLRLKIQLDP